MTVGTDSFGCEMPFECRAEPSDRADDDRLSQEGRVLAWRPADEH